MFNICLVQLFKNWIKLNIHLKYVNQNKLIIKGLNFFFLKFYSKQKEIKEAYQYNKSEKKTDRKKGRTELYELNETELVNPNVCKNISSIISRSTDMSDWLRNMNVKNLSDLSDDIDELPWNFTSVFEPFNSVQTIRFNQEMAKKRPSGSHRNEKTFVPNINNFRVNGRFYSDFFVELEQNISLIISEYSSYPTSRVISSEKTINFNLDSTYGRRYPKDTLRGALALRGTHKGRIQINIWN